MEPTVVRGSHKKMLLILCGLLPFWIFLLWMATSGVKFTNVMTPSAILIIYTPIVLFVAYRVFNPGERLIIDDSGLFAKGWKCGTIPWNDIESVYVAKYQKVVDYLCLRLKNEAIYTQHMSDFVKSSLEKSGLTPIAVAISGTDCSVDRLVKILSQRVLVERAK